MAVKTLRTLETIIEILPVTKKSVEMSLNSKFADFEDALQYFACLEAELGYLITRNKADYKHVQIPVLSAKDFISLYCSKESKR